MHYLVIINDGPYGSERPYNALRLTMNMQKVSQAEFTLAFMGDGVVNALKGQDTPQGFYNIERMLKGIMAKKGKVKL